MEMKFQSTIGKACAIIYDYFFSKDELNFNINNKVQSAKFLKWAELLFPVGRLNLKKYLNNKNAKSVAANIFMLF